MSLYDFTCQLSKEERAKRKSMPHSPNDSELLRALLVVIAEFASRPTPIEDLQANSHEANPNLSMDTKDLVVIIGEHQLEVDKIFESTLQLRAALLYDELPQHAIVIAKSLTGKSRVVYLPDGAKLGDSHIRIALPEGRRV